MSRVQSIYLQSLDQSPHKPNIVHFNLVQTMKNRWNTKLQGKSIKHKQCTWLRHLISSWLRLQRQGVCSWAARTSRVYNTLLCVLSDLHTLCSEVTGLWSRGVIEHNPKGCTCCCGSLWGLAGRHFTVRSSCIASGNRGPCFRFWFKNRYSPNLNGGIFAPYYMNLSGCEEELHTYLYICLLISCLFTYVFVCVRPWQ